ncbi:hypothetical protein PTTG_05422 [Puccinia triticina 1-1 BBBD Race 1]|uniref:MULE transposase domain-containing protein n=1 Tax=Puccinia triticina (isolate 1-1 / race 1 (BBBD)) TaxID=630390 RepID=A0A0C4EX74_PUCT1|nr:hypothetical protein PTTG_05422 [Puccinia triticina 1-1 BBBD Race 1]
MSSLRRSRSSPKLLKPVQTLLQLQNLDNKTYATNVIISNTLQKICREDLHGQTPMEALLAVLKESNWAHKVKVNSSGAVLHLFFAHLGSIYLACINHHVALLDLVYKTNRYGFPLLHGQAASNRSFSIGFCFMKYKDDENYLRLWAVNALRKHI